VAFVASVSQFLWAVPVALWADRGRRKVVAAVALLIFCVFGALMGLSPNIWWFVFLYLLASLGVSVNQTVHNSFLADAYPTEGRSRVFSLALSGRPHRPDGGHLDLRGHRHLHA
jgi:MFS family permease